MANSIIKYALCVIDLCKSTASLYCRKSLDNSRHLPVQCSFNYSLAISPRCKLEVLIWYFFLQKRWNLMYKVSLISLRSHRSQNCVLVTNTPVVCLIPMCQHTAPFYLYHEPSLQKLILSVLFFNVLPQNRIISAMRWVLWPGFASSMQASACWSCETWPLPRSANQTNLLWIVWWYHFSIWFS